jgi:3-oxoacyl-[acyl-carrier protein] reductase
MAFSLKNRAAVVTGAGRGIGRAIAEVFCEAGARVLLATRTRSSGEEAVASIVKVGGQAELCVCDLSSQDDCKRAIEAAHHAFGRLDIVVHNAAVYPICSIEQMSPAVLDETLNVNLKAAFWLSQAALPLLKQASSPRLLFTSSVTGPRVAMPGLAHYAASKAGLNGFIRSAAMEFAKYHITVNGIEPGLIRTEAIDSLGDEAQVANMAAQIPLKRLGTKQEIAYAMLYLASEEAAFTTGQTIIVDGGALLPENSSALE